MKILHLIYTNGIAGAEKYLHHLLPSLKVKGIECHLLIVCAKGFEAPLLKYTEMLSGEGIPAQLIISSRIGFFSTAGKISSYLKNNNIRYLHSHLLNSDIIASLVKTFFYRNVIVISTKHGYNETILKRIPSPENIAALKKQAKAELFYKVSKWTISKTDHHYAVSAAIAQLFQDLELTKTVMPFIHHGISVKVKEKPGELNKYRKSDKQLIIVGRLEEFKGHHYLIKAMPEIIKKYPECKLIIIGEGSLKQQLKSLAVESGVDNNIEFAGFQDDPYSYVNNSDVIILPSLFEPFGLVYIEAFALKTPVVAFDTPAGNEIMKNNETALMVPARNEKLLAEKILYLLENPHKAKAITDRAYEVYLNNFTTDKMVENTAAYYLKIQANNNG